MRRISAVIAAASLATGSPATEAIAADVDRGNGSYFNRPGATLDAMLAEVAACGARAEGADSQINGIPVLTAGLAAIIGGAIANGRLKRVNIENGMLIRGWRLFAITDAEGTACKALSDDGRKAELATLVGADAPARGTLLREWRNDYAEPALWARKPEGVQLTFSMTLFGGKKGERPLRAAIVPAGTYVLGGRRFNGNHTDVFCFGAPRFEVAAGAVTYIGGYQMLSVEKMADGERRNAMRYSADLDGARTALAVEYPRLAGRMAGWAPRNGSTYPCEADEFTAYAVPGAPAIEGSAPAR